MKLKEITAIRSKLPILRPHNDSANYIHCIVGDITALYGYNKLITFKHKDKPRILTKDWDYSRSTLTQLSKYLGKSPAEIRKSIQSFEYILEDNPCLS